MNVSELIKGCRTYRRFEQKPVPSEITEEILEAARIAPSARNAQPLSYIVVEEKTVLDKVFECTKWAGALPPELGMPKENERPVLYVAVIQNTEINQTSDTDAGLAIQNMSLVAWEKGIGRCILGALNRVELTKIFGLSDNQKIHSLIAFGYPSHKSSVTELKDSVNYFLDDKKDYLVPKRALSDIVTKL